MFFIGGASLTLDLCQARCLLGFSERLNGRRQYFYKKLDQTWTWITLVGYAKKLDLATNNSDIWFSHNTHYVT